MSWINMKGENLIRVEMSRKDGQKLLEHIDYVNETLSPTESDRFFMVLRLGDTLAGLMKEEKQ